MGTLCQQQQQLSEEMSNLEAFCLLHFATVDGVFVKSVNLSSDLRSYGKHPQN